MGYGTNEINIVKIDNKEIKDRLTGNENRLTPYLRDSVHPVDVDVNDIRAEKVETWLNIPTYIADNDEMVHPNILFFPDRWNGWHYWMAFTPYPGADPFSENPSIVVSDDGVNWQVPDGLTNPIEPQPPTGYNADTVLCLDPDGQTVYLMWKYADAEKTLFVRSSTDGINWVDKTASLVTATEEVSPAVLWDGKQFVMWSVNGDGGVYTLRRRKSPTITGGWSAFETCTLIDFPAGLFIWHIDIIKRQNQLHMIAQIGVAGGGNGNLYFAKSNDGLNWTFSKNPVLKQETSGSRWDNILYKSALVPAMRGSEFYYKLYYGSNTPFQVGLTEITFDKKGFLKERNTEIGFAINGIDPFIFADTFNRADDATGLGTSPTGRAWTNTISNLGISNRQVWSPNNVNARSVVDIGESDHSVSVEVLTIGTASDQGWILFRYADASNLWRLGFAANEYKLEKIVAGVVTIVSGYGVPLIGDIFGVECLGDEIKVTKNGIVMSVLTDATHNTATTIGLNIDNSTTRLGSILASKTV